MRRMMTDKEIATVESLRKDGILSLKDAHGNPRFVEGDITMETITGVTQTYGKWSLSGTHLMVVIIFNAIKNTTLDDNIFAKFSVPAYILNKITTLYRDIVETKEFRGYSNDYTFQPVTAHLINRNNELLIGRGGSVTTMTADRSYRIQFDLLIDADYDE